MRRVGICLAVLALMLASVATTAAGTGAPAVGSRTTGSRTTGSRTTGSAATGAGTARLALAMLSHLNPGANAVFSPLSVETALAMVDQGASGETATQLDTLLGAPSPLRAAQASARVTAALAHAVSAYGRGGPTLDIANGLWVGSGLALDRTFSETLDQTFHAAPQQTDFSDPATALRTINGWISTHTAGLIPTLLGPGQVTAQTELVLANAVYLHARWQTPFDPSRTTSQSFHAPTGSVSAPFMNSGDLTRFGYASTSDYQAVSLPYAHSSLQFLAVMPAAGRLDALEDSLSPARLSVIAAGLRTQALDLSMPKFTLSFQASLDGFLQSQGVTRAFGAQSQLDHMVAGRSLAIQAFAHAAVLKVAESGTVAAAASGVSVAPTAAPAQVRHLTLNRPFLIFLRDTQTGTILFAGRLENPSAG